MKTKLFFVMIAMMSMALSSCAQEASLPKFTKVLEVLNRGINVRAEPSTTSAKIGSNPEFLLVIDEDAEWYHAYVLIEGESEGRFLTQPGYVSKKVCKVREPKALNADYARNVMPEANLSFCVRKSGRYKDYCIVSYDEYYRRSDLTYLFVGKVYGNYAVGVQRAIEEDYGTERIKSFGDDGELLDIPLARVYPSTADSYDWNGLTDVEIDKLLETLDDDEVNVLLPGRVVYTHRDLEEVTGEGVVCYRYNASGKYDDEEYEEDDVALSAPTPQSFEHDRFALKQLKYDKFVEITKDGVNIRKQPNTKSPRLIAFYDPSEECLDCPAEHRWTTRQVKAGEGENASSKGMVMPLTGESGDWYQVHLGSIELFEYGYISKKFCKLINRKPLELPIGFNGNIDPNDHLCIYMIESGKYKGLCIVDEADAFNGESYIRLGVYYNGMCIFPYEIPYEHDSRTHIQDGTLYAPESALSKFSISTSTTLLDLLMQNLDLMRRESTIIYFDYNMNEFSPDRFSLLTKDVLIN